MTLTWTDGHLDGDDFAVIRVEQLIIVEQWLDRTPTGPGFTAALLPPWVALLTILEVFDEGRDATDTGDPVEFPDDGFVDGGIAYDHRLGTRRVAGSSPARQHAGSSGRIRPSAR